MFTICICLRFLDSFTIQATVIYLNSQIIFDKSALTFDLHQVPRDSGSKTLQIRPGRSSRPYRPALVGSVLSELP